MYDTVTVDTVPSNPQAVAGYVGGFWPTYSTLVAKFPNAHHLSIAVNAGEDAECLDIENGDAVPSDAPAWVRRQQKRGVYRPVLYCDLSTEPAVTATLTAAGIQRSEYRLWIAHYTYVDHIEAGADATQWTDRALGRNLDQSTCVNSFFDTKPAPPPAPVYNPPNYSLFSTGSFKFPKYGNLVEQNIVERYDGARKHPLVYGLYLKYYLQPRLQVLADHVAEWAIHVNPLPNGKPSWGVNHRGWRFQQLVHRAQGQRFV